MAAEKKIFKTNEELVAAINANTGYSFITLTTTTILDTNKFSRSRNEEIKTLKEMGVAKDKLPAKLAFEDVFKGPVFITSNRKGYGCGDYNYGTMVNNKRAKEGVATTFNAEAPKGREFANTGRSLLVSTSNPEQFYLRTYKFNESKDDAVMHYEDGTPLTDLEIKMLKDFTTPSAPATKQGIEDEIIVRDFKVEGIIGVTLNKKLYIREGFEAEFK